MAAISVTLGTRRRTHLLFSSPNPNGGAAMPRTRFLVAIFLAIGLCLAAAAPASAGVRNTLNGSSSVRKGPGAGVLRTKGDDVHISKRPPFEVSSHGRWWLENFRLGQRPTRADVTVWLQVKKGNSWVTVSRKTERVKEGAKKDGGRGKRATARFTCKNLNSTVWRSVVDVDLVGFRDTPEKDYTPPIAHKCGV